MAKRFILNADGFGMSKAVNRAVLETYENHFLKSASLTPNGNEFDEAVDKILPQCQGLGVGVHLNITSGKSLCSDLSLLTDSESNFKNSYLKLLLMAYNPKGKEFFSQLEREFRRQIEKCLSKTKISHIDSNSHIHAIPPIFELVCKLAKEYQIPEIRTHFEKLYLVPDIYRNFSRTFFVNFLKKLFLNLCTVFNENTVHQYGLKTNDYILGINYGSSMDSMVISYGLKALKYDKITVETAIHPCRYDEGTIDNHFNEYMITRNKKLQDRIVRSGYNITNYAEIHEKKPES